MNLLSKLHRNSVLTGPIESYCLACGCLLRSEEESYAHIHEPGHANKLSSVPQLADYNECIIKVKEGYFCHYCNIILPTIKRVGLHVTESKHRDNKISLSITRHGEVILAFDSVIINDRSWNGLDGSTCSVCNEDYDDEEHHKRGATHLLNLIQIKCEFGETYVYRKVDEELFFCLICNAILPLPEKETHHQSEKHLELVEKSKAEGAAVRNQKVKNKAASLIEPNNNTVKTPETKTSQIHKTKETEDIKPKTQENKTQNGSAVDIYDNRTGSSKNTEEPATLNTETPVFNFQATQKAKSENQSSVTQNASNLSYSKTIITASHPITLDSQSITGPTPTITVPTKVNPANEQISKESQIKNTPEQDKPKTEAKNAETKGTEAAKGKVEPKTKVNNNGTAKIQAHNAEHFLYEYLKARNFIIKAQDATAYCTLCEIGVDVSDIDKHSRDEHHNILYSKHAARKAKQSKTLMNGELKAKDSKAGINKENVAPVTGPNKNASQANSKPIVAKAKVVAKESNKENTEKDTALKQAIPLPLENEKETKVSILVNKEKTTTVIEQPSHQASIKIPDNQTKPQECKQDNEHSMPLSANNADNNVPKRNRSNERTTGETKQGPTETTVQNKKSAKKNQKKAAKAKVSETNAVLPKEVQANETDVSKVLEPGKSKAETAESTGLKDLTSGLLIGDDNTNNPKTKLETEQDASKHTDNKVSAAQFAEADLKTEKLLSLLQTVSHVDSASDVVVNGKHVLGNISFVLVLRTEDKAECVACDEVFTIDDINMHVTTNRHRSNVEECVVVTSLEDEFIRKVKTQGYHCGYCNIAIRNWDEMTPHLSSYVHNDAKTSAMWRLELYQPHLRVAGTKEVRSILTNIFRCTE